MKGALYRSVEQKHDKEMGVAVTSLWSILGILFSSFFAAFLVNKQTKKQYVCLS